MPSYRVTLAVGALRPGVAPAAVLPGAADAAREVAIVEASDVQVVSGQARIVVRFTADDGEIAAQVGAHVASRTAQLAAVTGWRLTEQVGGRWEPVT